MVKPRPNVQTPAQTLDFSATPWIGVDFWDDGLHLFHHWLCGQFDLGKTYPDYMLAERLDVHRCIADTWLYGLFAGHYLLRSPIEKGHNKETYAGGFIVTNPGKLIPVLLNIPEDLQSFDPWEDRTLDNEVPDAMYADYYIDKYYDVFVNEYYFYTGKMRKRPNKKTFSPIEHSEHPRHANIEQASKISLAPPPLAWRRLIDDLCSV